MISLLVHLIFFFFNDTATTEIYTLSLHDALPISQGVIVISDRCKRGDLFGSRSGRMVVAQAHEHELRHLAGFQKFGDRKSTHLNSSHDQISYAVFCLKKKKDK